MTIKELVEQLQQGRPDDQVFLSSNCPWGCCPQMHEVEEVQVEPVVAEDSPDGTRALYVVQGSRVEERA